ncbi:nucleotidyl transferase AbiEii/AbiGii toxin family protein [Flavobacterium aquidurense]|uniref:nucleotidyl transferase AbiEii/AbiGii toxin family protein n=1 Tax=Flavobacterium aquidurense TaxID=362413 RepID=UPI003757C701
MNLHLDKDSFEGAIVIAAEHFKVSEILIEKDYWVTYALRELFLSKVKDSIVFKGGTSLSKCYKIINRFSEDIDLIIIKGPADSGNALKNKLKEVTNITDDSLLSPIDDHPSSNKKGSIRKIVYSFPKLGMQGEYGEVGEFISVEVSHMGSSEPSETKYICSMIAEYVKKSQSPELIETFGLEDFKVTALGIERTFCEKIISLVRFSHTEKPIEELSKKVRHTYDLHLLLKQDKIKEFTASKKFDQMLLQVGLDDDKAIPNNKDWLYIHPGDALLFKSTAAVWDQLKKIYISTFKEMVTGEFPNEDEVLETLIFLSQRIQKMDWPITK